MIPHSTNMIATHQPSNNALVANNNYTHTITYQLHYNSSYVANSNNPSNNRKHNVGGILTNLRNLTWYTLAERGH